MTMALLRSTGFGRCPCGGVYEEKLVEIRLTVDGEEVVMTDVPQGACPVCESRVYKAHTLEEIEAAMRGRSAPPPRTSL
jgi:YgiT-type zinc finger domain-containing protein